jgi:SulP family sulfate permease
VHIFLVTAAVVAIAVASLSRFPFAIAGPDSQAAAILAVVAAGITSQLLQKGSNEAILPTIWVMISLGPGLPVYFSMRWVKLELGYIVRYIPYPVVGGFTAGVGWLTANGAMKVMTGKGNEPGNLPQLFQWQMHTLVTWGDFGGDYVGRHQALSAGNFNPGPTNFRYGDRLCSDWHQRY